MLRCRFIALLLTVLFTLAGRAFDTGPHFDLTRDALAAEGFGNTASQVAQVTGWMTDLYAAADETGETPAWLRERIAAGLATPEAWPEAAITAAARLHFDGAATVTLNGETKKLESGEAMAAEWDRLARATRAAAIDRANANDPQGLLMVLGASLRAVQDFYAHTNWVEPAGDAAKDGVDGPGWAALGTYGSHPTWFDVPPSVRAAARLHAGVGEPLREAGFWNSDGNRNLATALNKDWPGRPYYREAYITACFAGRQWVEAVHEWVNNEPVWHAAQYYTDRRGDELDRDLAAAFKISAHAGHWQGQGEPKGSGHEGPGGSADKLKAVLEEYRKAGKTSFRAAFEGFIPALATPTPPPGDTTVLFSWGMQANTDFIVLTFPRLKDDGGKADLYARATVAGQAFTSAILHGDDEYKPAAPITFIKSVPAGWKIDEPVTTLRVEVATGDAKDASTDDDVFLRLNDDARFKLERPKVNGFEKGSRETYALAPSNLQVKDIRYVQLEKGPDGKNGNWQLKGVKLEVNGQALYLKDKIDAMLAGGNLAWRAPDFVGRGGTTTDVPVMLALYADSGRLADDVQRDINPDFGRLDLMLLLDRVAAKFRGDLNGAGKAEAAGGSKYGGKGKEGTDPGKALLAFAVENVRTVPSTTRPGKISATLAAQPADYSGKLPATIAFNGTITVDGPCDVTYRFVRSDGAIMLTDILHFDEAGTKPVQDSWLIKQATAGWMMLKVEAPLATDSGRAEFEVKAGAAAPAPPATGGTRTPPATGQTPPSTTGAPPPATPPTTVPTAPPTVPAGPGVPQPITEKGITILLTAEPMRHTGALPVTVTFKGSITVNKAMDVKYRLVRSDGMLAPPKTIHFGAAGTKEIRDLWVQREAGSGWVLLRIEEPVKLDSNKAEFEVAPGAPPTPAGPVTPPATTGPTTPPTTGPVTPPTTTGAVTPPTTTGPTPPANTGPLKTVTATLSATPERYIWRLPAIVTFNGALTADGAGTVAYRFVRSDGAIMPLRTLVFKAAGTKPIKDVWMFKQAFDGWMQIKIEQPLEAESNQAAFEVAPTDNPLPAVLPPTPTTPATPTTPTAPTTPTTPTTPVNPTPPPTPAAVKVTATLAANPAKYGGKYPAVIAFKGSITVDGPCEVKYRFLRSDDAIMPEQTVRFAAAGTKEVQEFWVLTKAGAGWVSLNVAEPAVVEVKANFEVLPEGTAPTVAAPPTTPATPTPPTTPATPATPTVTPPPTTPAAPPATPATPGKFGATLTADPPRTDGKFPAFVTFKGAITMEAPGTVTYRFVRSDGAIMPLRTLVFKTAGTKEIKDTWVFKQTFNGWMQLKIEAPAEAESNEAAFEVPGG